MKSLVVQNERCFMNELVLGGKWGHINVLTVTIFPPLNSGSV